jgi:hypothetical protein
MRTLSIIRCVGVIPIILSLIAICWNSIAWSEQIEQNHYYSVIESRNDYDSFIDLAIKVAAVDTGIVGGSSFIELYSAWIENLYSTDLGEFTIATLYGTKAGSILKALSESGQCPPTGDNATRNPLVQHTGMDQAILMFYKLWGGGSLIFSVSSAPIGQSLMNIAAEGQTGTLDSRTPIWIVHLDSPTLLIHFGGKVQLAKNIGRNNPSVHVEVLYDLGRDLSWAKVNEQDGYNSALAFLVPKESTQGFSDAVVEAAKEVPIGALRWESSTRAVKETYWRPSAVFHRPAILRLDSERQLLEERNAEQLSDFINSGIDSSSIVGLQLGLRDGHGLLVLLRSEKAI